MADITGQMQAAENVATPMSSMPELQAYFAPVFRNQVAVGAGKRAGVEGSLRDDEEEQARRAANAQRQASLKQQAEALDKAKNPKYFQRVRKEDGGFDFLTGDGKPITAWQFAQAKGLDLPDVLKGSKNKEDMQFLNDYGNMETFLQATSEGDDTKLEQIFKEQPELRGMKYEDLMGQFRGSYANIFGHYEGEQGQNLNRRVVNSPTLNSLNQEASSAIAKASEDTTDFGDFGGEDFGGLDTANLGSQQGVDAYGNSGQTGQQAYQQNKNWYDDVTQDMYKKNTLGFKNFADFLSPLWKR